MIDIDISKVEALAEKIGHANVVGAINTGIQKGTFYLEGIAKEETPVDQGKLRNSYRSRFSSLYGQLVNTAKYAPFVHFGTQPHMVSVKHIRAWAERKGLNPGAIARSVWSKGTKANPFMDRTAQRGEDGVRTILESEVISATQKAIGA